MATKTLEERAQQRVLDREVEAIKSEDGQRRIARENEAAKQALITEVQEAAKACVDAREALLPVFIEALTQSSDTAVKLVDTRARYLRAVSAAQRLGITLDAVWPRAYGREVGERNAIATALRNIGDVGGRV